MGAFHGNCRDRKETMRKRAAIPPFRLHDRSHQACTRTAPCHAGPPPLSVSAHGPFPRQARSRWRFHETLNGVSGSIPIPALST